MYRKHTEAQRVKEVAHSRSHRLKMEDSDLQPILAYTSPALPGFRVRGTWYLTLVENDHMDFLGLVKEIYVRLGTELQHQSENSAQQQLMKAPSSHLPLP